MPYVNLRNLQFLLKEFLAVEKLQSLPRYADFDAELANLLLDTAQQLGDQYLYPFYREMDKNKAYYQDGRVFVNPAVGEGMRAMGEGGWLNASWDYEQGGQQLPLCVTNAGLFVLYAANANIAAYGSLTAGAANLIRSFATTDLQATYLSKMMSGHWQGTMALTEPQAGSSLSDISTHYTPVGDGAYSIKGQKIYISGGDHDSTENVVHLLLARRKDGPVGTKGISLFIVPKYRPEGSQLIDNHVTTAGIYGKMGQKGYVAAHLMYGEQGETRGFLVGEEFQGLKQMFLMMNEARIGTGLMAAATASAAYYASLQYAQERPQGRHPDNKDLHAPPVLIIEHADVKRMLLFQKAVVEGSIALLLQCSYYNDLAEAHTDPDLRHRYHLLLELLTPIAKSYPSEYGNEAVSVGMQVLGGAGYTDDFPLEQYFRDIRVNSIYEGTTTIHGMDLLGRKLLLENGKAIQFLTEEIQAVIQVALTQATTEKMAQNLAKSLGGVQQVMTHLIGLAKTENPRVFLADATLFLDYFALHVLAWIWLKQANTASQGLTQASHETEKAFYQAKLRTARYFFSYELPKSSGLKRILLSDERIPLEASPNDFL